MTNDDAGDDVSGSSTYSQDGVPSGSNGVLAGVSHDAVLSNVEDSWIKLDDLDRDLDFQVRRRYA